MYLLYDVLQLQQLSLGHSLLVKRQNWHCAKNNIASLTVEQLVEAAKATADRRPIEDPLVLSLLQDLTAIGRLVPLSYSQKLKM